jgi:hypothetical protein
MPQRCMVTIICRITNNGTNDCHLSPRSSSYTLRLLRHLGLAPMNARRRGGEHLPIISEHARPRQAAGQEMGCGSVVGSVSSVVGTTTECPRAPRYTVVLSTTVVSATPGRTATLQIGRERTPAPRTTARTNSGRLRTVVPPFRRPRRRRGGRCAKAMIARNGLRRRGFGRAVGNQRPTANRYSPSRSM